MVRFKFEFCSDSDKIAQAMKRRGHATGRNLLCAYSIRYDAAKSLHRLLFLRPTIVILIADVWQWFNDSSPEELMSDISWVSVHELIHMFGYDHSLSEGSAGWVFV